MTNNFKTAPIMNPERKKVVSLLISSALNEVEKKYGTGHGDGENPKRYHNREHSENVVIAVRGIIAKAIEKGTITEQEGDIALVAAASHDLEQGLGPEKNEHSSAQILTREMLKSSMFSIDEIERAGNAVSATNFKREGSAIIQAVTNDYLTRIVADADLSALGGPTPKYWEAAQNLLKETKNIDEPTLEDQRDWAEVQVGLLYAHHFFTEEARELFPHVQENLLFTEDELIRLNAEISKKTGL